LNLEHCGDRTLPVGDYNAVRAVMSVGRSSCQLLEELKKKSFNDSTMHLHDQGLEINAQSSVLFLVFGILGLFSQIGHGRIVECRTEHMRRQCYNPPPAPFLHGPDHRRGCHSVYRLQQSCDQDQSPRLGSQRVLPNPNLVCIFPSW
jgi:hypothetical protein